MLRPADQSAIEGALAAARASLGDTHFAEAWATGQTLPVEQIVAHTLAGSEERSAKPGQDAREVVTCSFT